MAAQAKPPPPAPDVDADAEDEGVTGGARSFWSGTLSFGLVSIPVNLFPAYRPLGVALHTLAPDGSPLQRRYFCSKDGKAIDREHLVRGYPLEKDRYVVLTDEELASLEPNRSRDIELTRFVDVDAIPPEYFERAYFLAPGGASVRAYELLTATLARLEKAGIASFVMRGKQHLVAIFSEHGVLLAETLRFPEELRSAADLGLTPTKASPTAQIGQLRRVIRERSKSGLALNELRDEHAARLHALVERKRKAGKDLVTPDVTVDEPSPDNVVDLMTQLKQSLEGTASKNDRGARKKPPVNRERTTRSKPRAAKRASPHKTA